jgi:hypothetical protein
MAKSYWGILQPPAFFGLKALIIAGFIFLANPYPPMMIPAALGGGLCFMLIFS